MSKVTIDTTNSNFETIRLLISIRDNHHCQIHQLLNLPRCDNNNTEIHHITPIKDKGSNTPDNLILLCTKHHRIIHGLTNGYQTKEQTLRLKLILAENGISQTELAGVLNITQSAIAQMLQTSIPRILQAVKIKDYLQARTGKNYTLEELFQLVRIKKSTL